MVLVPNLRCRHPGSLWASAWCNDAPRDWSGYSQYLELRANILEKQELGANIAIHDNKVIPNCRVCQCYGVLACVGNSSGTGRIQNQAAQHGILPAETISSFQRVLPNLVSLQVVNRTLLNVAISSFSEKPISPRGFNQIINDRVRCLISKRMI